MMGKIKDLTGMHFHNWNVIGLSEQRDKHGNPLWDCVCDCQMSKSEAEREHRLLQSSRVTSGKAKCQHCYVKPGTIDFKAMVGKTYHRLLVVKDLGRMVKEGTTQAKRYVECVCTHDGNTVIAPAYDVYHGNIRSCGCLQKELVKNVAKTYLTKRNEFHMLGDTTFVKFSNCNEWFICDTEDWSELQDHCWHKDIKGYAAATIDGKTTFMHKLVMKTPDDLETDHIYQVKNGVCDNRKSNLEIKPRKYNARNSVISKSNTSGYKGVTASKNKQKWIARIMVDGKSLHLGTFETIEEAVEARRKADIKYSGGYRMNLQ